MYYSSKTRSKFTWLIIIPMELISTTKTYHLHFAYAISDKEEEYVSIISHYDGKDMNTIRIITKDVYGHWISDERVEQFVQSKYIEYCQENGILYE